MFRARERGMSYWPFVITLVTTIFFVIQWYQTDEKLTKARSDAVAAKATASQATTKWETEHQKMLDLQDVLGATWCDETGYPDKAKIEAGLTAVKTAMVDGLRLKIDVTKFTETGEGGKIEKIGQEPAVVVYASKGEYDGITNWAQFVPSFMTSAKRMLSDVGTAVNKSQQVQAELASAIEAQKAAISAKDDARSQVETQLASTRAAAQQTEQDLREQIDSLNGQLRTARDETTAVREEKDQMEAALTNEVSQAKAEIVRLVDRARPLLSEGPDGSVLTARGGVAVIDRGKKDKLMPGTIFSVWGLAKGGVRYHKGSIKVVTVADDTSRASILESLDGDPILGGDLIQSTTYSPKEKLSFALVGEFVKMGRGDAATRLRALGCDVHDTVVPTTHYLVVGVPAEGETLEETESYRRAKEFGVTIITEAQLASFTRY